MGLVQKISESRGVIALTTGLIFGVHMAYQYVYINQCRNTGLTVAEKFVGIALIAYGLIQVNKDVNKDNRNRKYNNTT